tara:strand:- start:4527 stop:5795 length:1269 start_codon:yes stop_codon:yes gene_type:complete
MNHATIDELLDKLKTIADDLNNRGERIPRSLLALINFCVKNKSNLNRFKRKFDNCRTDLQKLADNGYIYFNSDNEKHSFFQRLDELRDQIVNYDSTKNPSSISRRGFVKGVIGLGLASMFKGDNDSKPKTDSKTLQDIKETYQSLQQHNFEKVYLHKPDHKFKHYVVYYRERHSMTMAGTTFYDNAAETLTRDLIQNNGFKLACLESTNGKYGTHSYKFINEKDLLTPARTFPSIPGITIYGVDDLELRAYPDTLKYVKLTSSYRIEERFRGNTEKLQRIKQEIDELENEFIEIINKYIPEIERDEIQLAIYEYTSYVNSTGSPPETKNKKILEFKQAAIEILERGSRPITSQDLPKYQVVFHEILVNVLRSKIASELTLKALKKESSNKAIIVFGSRHRNSLIHYFLKLNIAVIEVLKTNR